MSTFLRKEEVLIALLVVIVASTSDAGASECIPKIDCSCAAYVKDNGWMDFDGLGEGRTSERWWNKATSSESGYKWGRKPRVGAVLVLKPWNSEPNGHVAIVSRLVDEKTIKINHANYVTKNDIALNGTVIDTSPVAGEWHTVSIERNGQQTGNYEIYGFIYPRVSEEEIDRYLDTEAPLIPLPNSTMVEWLGRESMLKKARNSWFAASQFQYLAIRSGIIAKQCLRAGNVDSAVKFRDRMYSYSAAKQGLSSTAHQIYLDTIDVAEAEVKIKAAMTAIGFATGGISPVLGAFFEGLSVWVDYSVDSAIDGSEEALKNLAVSVVSKALLLGLDAKYLEPLRKGHAKELTDAWGKSGVYEYLLKRLGSTQFKEEAVKYFMSAIGSSSRVPGRVTKKIAESLIDWAINKIASEADLNPNTVELAKNGEEKVHVPDIDGNAFCNGGLKADNEKKPGLQKLNISGTWEDTRANNHWQMDVTWNRASNRYEGTIRKNGVESELVGFSIGELVWIATPTSDPEKLQEQQKWRSGSNGVSTGFEWRNGTVYLDQSTDSTLTTSQTTFQKLNLGSNKATSPVQDSPNGTSVALVLDRSGSMLTVQRNPDGSSAQRLHKAKQASKAFILGMKDGDAVSISGFSGKGETFQSMAPVAEVGAALDNVLGKIGALWQGTNIGAGLEQGFNQLAKAGGSQRSALLLSDGENNVGKWDAIVNKYKANGWPICTIGFGGEAGETTLKNIARETGCAYAAADTFDVVGKYQQLGAYMKNESMLLVVSDMLAVNGTSLYDFVVGNGVSVLSGNTNWAGSQVKTTLVDPAGNEVDVSRLSNENGRYVEGDDFQHFELKNPQPGKWAIKVSWSEAPPKPEQVNIQISEKSDVFAQILPFRPQYKKQQPVTLNVVVKDLAGIKKTPMGSTSISAKVQKPGPQMVRMVQARSTNWTMYKDVALDVTRELKLFDDGKHDDYKAGDGIFGNTFRETDLQGAYLVTANVRGQKRSGQAIEKTLRSTFQVGPITHNKVSNSQTLRYMEQARANLDDSAAYSDELLGKPLQEIDNMGSDDPLDDIEGMQGNDPMDDIDQMLNSD